MRSIESKSVCFELDARAGPNYISAVAPPAAERRRFCPGHLASLNVKMSKLNEVITPDCIKVPLSARNKREAIEELVEVLCRAGRIPEKDPLLEAVLEREATRSTGIGRGLAIPHGKCTGLSGLVAAAGKPAQPIDFESIDGKPVNFIVLLGSPIDQTGPHIQALARISRLMTTDSFRKSIDRAQSPKEVHRAFVEHET